MIEIMTKKLTDLNNDEEFIELMSAEEENKMLLNSRIQEATAKGIAQGKAEGIKENAIETAKKLLEMKMSVNDISTITGLSKEEIKDLQK